MKTFQLPLIYVPLDTVVPLMLTDTTMTFQLESVIPGEKHAIHSLYEWVLIICRELWMGFPGGAVVKNPPSNAGDIRDGDLIPGSGSSLGEGHGSPLQHSYLENPMDRGAWQATVYRVTKIYIWLKQLNVHACILGVRNFCVKIYVMKLTAYSEKCWICDLQRFSFGTRLDHLRAFV